MAAASASRMSANNLPVLETPLLRVSRPVAACSRCRAAKVKCDGKLPACTACEKSNRAAECSSTNDQFARGKERSYVATLEARVERLEKKIAEARARRKSSAVLMHDAAEATPTRRTSVDTVKPSKPVSKRAARLKEDNDIAELVSDFGLLALNATSRDFYGFTSAMSYARLILSASSKNPLPPAAVKPLPPKFAATPIIQHYLTNIYTLLPFFDEAAFYRSLDAVYHLDSTIASAQDHWNVRMVLAVSSLAQSEHRADSMYQDAVGHVSAALQYKEVVLRPGRISGIQALLFLVQYAMMDPHHFDSWTLIGAASRLLVDLGIHQDPSRSTPISKAKLEVRRRVYWCVYALDRSTSLVQARAFSFSDESAHVGRPFHMPALSPKSTTQAMVFQQSFDAALQYFKIREIQSEWYMDLFQSGRDPWHDPYPYIWKTYAKMAQWFEDIPTTMLPSTRSFFELELLYSYVYILSPSARNPHIHEYAQRLIFEHCIAYASLLLELTRQPSNTTKPPITFYDAMRAYMTGRQFVDVLSRNMAVLLDPTPPSPPASTPELESEDPLSPVAKAGPPPFPSPAKQDGQSSLPDPASRAIGAVNNFVATLDGFGRRFGFMHWQERFQRESEQLLAQLYTHVSHTSPSLQVHVQPWPAGLPQQQSPFSTGSYTGTSPGSDRQQSPFEWMTPPQTIPELPQPSGGRSRHALVFGPGIPPSQRRKSPSGGQHAPFP